MVYGSRPSSSRFRVWTPFAPMLHHAALEELDREALETSCRATSGSRTCPCRPASGRSPRSRRWRSGSRSRQSSADRSAAGLARRRTRWGTPREAGATNSALDRRTRIRVSSDAMRRRRTGRARGAAGLYGSLFRATRLSRPPTGRRTVSRDDPLEATICVRSGRSEDSTGPMRRAAAHVRRLPSWTAASCPIGRSIGQAVTNS